MIQAMKVLFSKSRPQIELCWKTPVLLPFTLNPNIARIANAVPVTLYSRVIVNVEIVVLNCQKCVSKCVKGHMSLGLFLVGVSQLSLSLSLSFSSFLSLSFCQSNHISSSLWSKVPWGALWGFSLNVFVIVFFFVIVFVLVMVFWLAMSCLLITLTLWGCSINVFVILFVIVFVIVIVFVLVIVFSMVRSCLFISMIKCVNGHKSLKSLFEGVL